MNIVPIQSADDHRIAIFRNQRDAWLRAQACGGTGLVSPAPTSADPLALEGPVPAGLFMAEGQLVVRALIDSAYPVCSVLITPARLEALKPDLARLDPAVPIYLAERPLLAAIVGFDMHRGVLAAGERAGVPSAAEVAASAQRLLIMEDLANHDNVGGLLRSLAALGGPRAGALLSPRTCDPFYRKALRVSMGCALRLPIARLEPWPHALARLRDAGWRLIALTTTGEPLDPRAASMPEPALTTNPAPITERTAIIVGAEGHGLTPAALAMASEHRSIPMAPGIDSLNVTVAASLAMWALWQSPPPEPPTTTRAE